MKDSTGKEIQFNDEVIISDEVVKEANLLTNKGVVVVTEVTYYQLKFVKVMLPATDDIPEKTIDINSNCLTVLEKPELTEEEWEQTVIKEMDESLEQLINSEDYINFQKNKKKL